MWPRSDSRHARGCSERPRQPLHLLARFTDDVRVSGPAAGTADSRCHFPLVRVSTRRRHAISGVVVECIVSSVSLEIRFSLVQAHTADVGIERKTMDASRACGEAATRVCACSRLPCPWARLFRERASILTAAAPSNSLQGRKAEPRRVSCFTGKIASARMTDTT